jgi:DNA ligase (NAD+)
VDSAQEEIIKLSQIISQWQHSYYAGHPEVDDAHFDLAFDRLLDLEKEYPQFVLPDSPTSRVGSDLTNDLAQVEHTLPVLSLDKAYTLEEIHTWIEKTQKNAEGDLALTLEEKLDGVSIVLYYKDGLLDKAVTRGNGAVGNDVTANVKTISSIPLRLPEQVNLVARGEIFMTKRNFAQQNAKVGEIFANPRNYAAGTIRRKISREVAEVPLDIFVYEGFFDPPLDSQEQILKKLEEFGFPLNKNRGFFGQKAETEGFWEFQGNFDTLEQQIQLAAQRRSSLDYEIDGLVLKVNDIDTRERLGFTGHHPRWALAYKFESPQGISVVLGIDVQVGRTGRITPVARISPVEVGGSTISNVTLHNQGYIDALELGIGDEVVVSKRGDVIPAIERGD